MARDLPAEGGALLAHPALEERVAHAVHVGRPAGALDHVTHRAAGADVVEDGRAGLLREDRLGQERGEEVAVHEATCVVYEEAAVGVAVPGDAQLGTLRQDLLHHEAAVLGQERVGLVIGELAVGLPVGLHLVQRQRVEDGPHHRPRHPVPAVQHDLHRPDAGGVHEARDGRAELVVDGLLVEPAAGLRRRSELAFGNGASHVADPGVSRERDRPALDQLGPGVVPGVVRGGAHQPAVELARSDREIEDLGAHPADVQDIGALVPQPIRIAGRHGRRREAHVPAKGHPQLGGRAALARGQHAGERPPDPVRRVLVQLVGVDASDVVRLEDRGIDHAAALNASVTSR